MYVRILRSIMICTHVNVLQFSLQLESLRRLRLQHLRRVSRRRVFLNVISLHTRQLKRQYIKLYWENGLGRNSKQKMIRCKVCWHEKRVNYFHHKVATYEFSAKRTFVSSLSTECLNSFLSLSNLSTLDFNCSNSSYKITEKCRYGAWPDVLSIRVYNWYHFSPNKISFCNFTYQMHSPISMLLF